MHECLLDEGLDVTATWVIRIEIEMKKDFAFKVIFEFEAWEFDFLSEDHRRKFLVGLGE